jgi:fibrillarin-like pre-rRNA processing protein
MVLAIEESFPGVFRIEVDSREVLATINLTPGLTFYGEQLIKVDDAEYRSWNPYRSKLAAAVLKGMRNLHISSGDKILYLGVASGTTCSHISDIVGVEGHIWGVDFSPRPLRDMIDNLARRRLNVSPILSDARTPEAYSAAVPRVNVIYADVAQPDQADIVVKNAKMFLKPGGTALMAVKSRSIDVSRSPQRVYAEQIEVLRVGGFEILEVLELGPFEKDHAMAVARFRP